MKFIQFLFEAIRKPFQGECVCEDCGKKMNWNSSEWTLIDAEHLLCHKCVMKRAKEDRLRW